MKGAFFIPCFFFLFCVYSSTRSEPSCATPRDEHVVSPFLLGWFSRLGRSRPYQCEPGYKATADRAECTENGWSPKPLCKELKCTVPTIENAIRLEKVGARLEYQCNPGYEPEGFVITCNQEGVWDQMHHCTAKRLDCGPPPLISDAVQELKEEYKNGEIATYECPANYVKSGDPHLTCIQGSWTGNGECLPKTLNCGPPPLIKDAVQDLKNEYKDGEIATYECPAYFTQAGDPHMTCRKGRWLGNGECLQPCTVNVEDMESRNIEILFGGRSKIYSKHGDFISFRCQRGFKHKEKDGFRQQCINGKIDLPSCG
ncbi:complement factor H-related protein 1 [Astyanax mexicanus]|uniref:complement factor H-related protein 1 n=1 Tax=Astyanax mexicanus TaxID=7994 RepID=UPI0020CAA9EC|nr:complement factor H-related protein 1 [Astyanax mexicanus]